MLLNNAHFLEKTFYCAKLSTCEAPFQYVRQWHLTAGTHAPWGYEELKQGIRNTNIFRNTHPENSNPIFYTFILILCSITCHYL